MLKVWTVAIPVETMARWLLLFFTVFVYRFFLNGCDLLVYCGRLHSWLCQTMDHSRLHNFAVLSIENDIAVKLSRAIEIHTIFGDHWPLGGVIINEDVF